MELVNMYLSIFTAILFRGLNFGYPGQDSLLPESPGVSSHTFLITNNLTIVPIQKVVN